MSISCAWAAEMPVPALVLLGPSSWEGAFVAALAHPASGVAVARRCLDTADLLAAAAAGIGRVAVVGAGAPRLDADVLDRLRASGVAAVGVVQAGDVDGARLLARRDLLVVTVDPQDVGRAVRETAAAAAELAGLAGLAGLDGPAGLAGLAAAQRAGTVDPVRGDRSEGLGRIVAVWGPPGAPGRTTVAIALADEAARLGVPALLVDADTWAPSAAVVLGVVDDAPGLASACRRASAGTLDADALAALAREVRPGLRLLAGIPRAGRWTEVRAAALSDVLHAARSLAPLVVVDVGAPLESDEELVFDTAAPRRNAAALVTLEEADRVLVVASADPLGLVRLVAGVAELRDAVRGVEPAVVVTRLRESALGRRPQPAVSAAVRRHCDVEPWTVPDDPAVFDAALREGATLAESAPASPARHALRGIAVELLRDLGLREPQRLRAAR
jgi:MinD-like ATPase involved in chromosome partitioning or flagellar assembly